MSDTAPVPAAAVTVRVGSVADDGLIKGHRAAAQLESKKYRGRIPSSVGSRGANGDGEVVAAGDVVVIGRVGSSDVGSVVVTPLDSDDADDAWLIRHVFVDDDFREVGVADAMITAVLSELRSRGASHVAAHAQPGDRSLKNLFERHGLVAETITVGRRFLSD